MRTLPSIRPGETIGIMAPANRVDQAQIDPAIRILESMGYKVKVHPQTYLAFHSSAGTPQQKADAFHELWDDAEVKAIMAARGGNEAGEMLALLDYNKLKNNPKILVGFSDITTLINTIADKSDIVTFHGPVLNRIQSMDQGQLTQCFRLLSGHEKNIPLNGCTVEKSGECEGHLVGGNLSVLCSMLGTGYEPEFQGAVLFLEDIGDELSRINRFFLQLKLAGVFNKINGLIIGDFSHMTDTGKTLFDRTVHDMVRHHTTGTSFPQIFDAPFGHENDLVTFPVGATVKLSAKGNPTLTII
ncbi:MAG: LD-carboxypeptidase [Micavibrio sp.]